MTDLLPCELPCQKCGSTDVARMFRARGEMWRIEKYGDARSKYASASAYVATSFRDHINHRCRCCRYEWQTLPMRRKAKAKKEPTND